MLSLKTRNKNDIQSKVQSDLNQQQREFFLHQQMKTIQEELGGVSHDSEAGRYEKSFQKNGTKILRSILIRK